MTENCFSFSEKERLDHFSIAFSFFCIVPIVIPLIPIEPVSFRGFVLILTNEVKK